MDGGQSYSVVEPAPGGAGREIVRYDPATGKPDVLVSAEQLTPTQIGKPLAFAEYTWSDDGKKLMVATNVHRVLIRKTAGECWVLDRLIIHGTVDDNVHFQGDQRLINRPVDLGKQFDFMEYPNRTHGITEGRGTSLHVYTMISRYLEEHLPAGGR